MFQKWMERGINLKHRGATTFSGVFLTTSNQQEVHSFPLTRNGLFTILSGIRLKKASTLKRISAIVISTEDYFMDPRYLALLLVEYWLLTIAATLCSTRVNRPI